MEIIKLFTNERMFEVELVSFEGELMKVRTISPHDLSVGQFVLCVYRDKQVETRVLSVTPERLYLFVPLFPKQFLDDRRNFPRIPVDMPVTLVNENCQTTARLQDLSHRGFGLLTESEFEVTDTIYQLIVQSEILPISFQIIIHNKTEHLGSTRLGAVLHHIETEDSQKLSRFILTNQLL